MNTEIKPKGMLVSIMGRDCTNRGVTSGKQTAVLIGPGIPQMFEPTDNAPALALQVDMDPKGAAKGALVLAKPEWLNNVGATTKRPPQGAEIFGDGFSASHKVVRAVAVPAGIKPTTWTMFGGHYIESGDSRFPFANPIPVHDRIE